MRIVEIGPSSGPAYIGSKRLKEKLDSGASYIGIDIKPRKIGGLANNDRVSVVGGDIKKLPLPDGVADEIWLLNVLGAGLVSVPDKLPDGTLSYCLNPQKIFNELNRILKPMGTIFIGEYIPEVDKWAMEEDYEQYGFSKQVYTGETLQNFTTQHGMSFDLIKTVSKRDDTPPFFMALTKTS